MLVSVFWILVDSRARKREMSFIIKAVAKWHNKELELYLRRYGLKYDDILMAENVDVQRAMRYLDPRV